MGFGLEKHLFTVFIQLFFQQKKKRSGVIVPRDQTLTFVLKSDPNQTARSGLAQPLGACPVCTSRGPACLGLALRPLNTGQRVNLRGLVRIRVGGQGV